MLLLYYFAEEFMSLLLVIGFIVLAVFVGRLNKRVKALEGREFPEGEVPVSDGSPQRKIAPDAFLEEASEKDTTKPVIRPVPAGPNAFDRLLTWLKEDWVLKLGGLLILIGFGWLVTYAFLQGWIGPAGRITLGIVSGIAILILGEWRIRKYVHQGGVFLVLGSTVVLLTMFAARELYDFFTPVTALGVMFLSVAFVALSSVRHRTQALAIASIVLAGATPFLTNAPLVSNYVGVFSYLLVVALGTLWIVALTGWRTLTLAALALVSFYSIPHLIDGGSASPDSIVLLLFAFVFTALFFVTNTLGIVKLEAKAARADVVTAAGTGLFLLAWIVARAAEEWQSLLISAWMVVFGIGAFMVYQRTGRREPFYVYAGVAVAMLAAATAAELSGPALVIAYTIESAVVALVTYAVLRDLDIAKKASFLLAGPVLLSIPSFLSRSWRTSILHDDFFVLFTLAVALLGLGVFFFVRDRVSEETDSTAPALLVAGSAYVYALLWLSLHAGIANDDTATLIALLAYTVAGLAAYMHGRTRGKKGLTLYGGVLITFVVGRLILVEVGRMSLTGKIITFFLIGALLMSTAFIGRKKKGQSAPAAKE